MRYSLKVLFSATIIIACICFAISHSIELLTLREKNRELFYELEMSKRETNFQIRRGNYWYDIHHGNYAKYLPIDHLYYDKKYTVEE